MLDASIFCILIPRKTVQDDLSFQESVFMILSDFVCIHPISCCTVVPNHIESLMLL